MLTDQQAHDLLHRAADTVNVQPTGPVLVPPGRRVWPVFAAVASVVLVVGGMTALTGGDDVEPAPRPPATIDDDGHFRLGPDQVPSVFGYSKQDAVAMLEGRGFHVVTTIVATAPPVEPDCGDLIDRAIGTEPAAGTLIEPGDRIVLEVSGPNGHLAYCLPQPMRAEAWGLIDYANGRGERPATAPGVDLQPLVASLHEWSSFVGRYESGPDFDNELRFPTPVLITAEIDEPTCGELPAPLGGGAGTTLAMSVDVPSDGFGMDITRCRSVFVKYDDQDRIIGTYVPPLYVEDHPFVPADVVGNSVADATQRLEAQGLTVATVGRVDCTPVGVVSAQRPFQVDGEPAAPGSVVVIAFTNELGPCLKNHGQIKISLMR